MHDAYFNFRSNSNSPNQNDRRSPVLENLEIPIIHTEATGTSNENECFEVDSDQLSNLYGSDDSVADPDFSITDNHCYISDSDPETDSRFAAFHLPIQPPALVPPPVQPKPVLKMPYFLE